MVGLEGMPLDGSQIHISFHSASVVSCGHQADHSLQEPPSHAMFHTHILAQSFYFRLSMLCHFNYDTSRESLAFKDTVSSDTCCG